MLCGRSAGSPRDEARAPRATGLDRNCYDGSKPQPPSKRGVGAKEPRPTDWDEARCEMAAQSTTPSPQRAVRALWPVGWFFTGLNARGPRATELERDGYDNPKPQPPFGRGFGEEQPRPMAWGGARPALAAKTTTPSPRRAVRALWAVRWFSTGRSTGVARHGTRTRQLRQSKAAAADLAQCRCRGASANGVG